MSGAERQQRYMAKLLAGKPSVTKPAKPDAAKDARIRELEAALAQAHKRIAELERRGAGPQLTRSHRREADGVFNEVGKLRGSGPNAQISKFIRHLGNANEAEATAAARKLVSGLAASESDRHALAELWENHCKEQARQRPPKPKPIDSPDVERAIKTYAEGKTKVNFNKLAKAVRDQVPALKDQHGEHTYHFIVRCLRRLGFVKRGEWTYERTAPTN
jgi:hypothetical protein